MKTAKLITIILCFCETISSAAPALKRSLKICVATNAPMAVKEAANRILSQASAHPTLRAMTDGVAPKKLTDSRALLNGPLEARAFSHLVVIGMPDDPLVQSVWQKEAKADGDSLYVFGFGQLKGDIGFIESERNPFLHSDDIRVAPFEAMVVTITGVTEKGLGLAAGAFLDQTLINGVVAAPGWTRTEPTLLDRDPLTPGFRVPDVMGGVKNWTMVGMTQSPEHEYRWVLQDTGVAPREMWRFKYYQEGQWDRAGAINGFENYMASLHRRAYGNSILAVRFGNADQARQAAARMAGPARLKRGQDGLFTGKQPELSERGFRDPASPKNWQATYTLRTQGEWVLFSSLSATSDSAKPGKGKKRK